MLISSSDQKINSPFICKKSDKFKVLEEKLYEKYPNLKDNAHLYLCKGDLIDIEKTLKENRIENGDSILIFNINELE